VIDAMSYFDFVPSGRRRSRTFTNTLLAPIALSAALVGPVNAQFSTGAVVSKAPPVSKPFLEGFNEGQDIAAKRIQPGGYADITQTQKNIAKTALTNAEQNFKAVNEYVTENWRRADEHDRGKVAGEIAAAVLTAMQSAVAIGKISNVQIEDHTLEVPIKGNVFGGEADVERMLTDVAADLTKANDSIPADANQSGWSKFMHSKVAGALPGFNNAQLEIKGNEASEASPVQAMISQANAAQSASEGLALLLGVKSAAAAGLGAAAKKPQAPDDAAGQANPGSDSRQLASATHSPLEGSPQFRGLSLGMTVEQTQIIAAKNGGTTDIQQQNGVILGLNFKDAQFEYVIEFNDQRKTRVISIRPLDKNAKSVGIRRGPLYSAAVQAFGQPSKSSALQLRWDGPGQSHIQYDYSPDELWPVSLELSDHP